MANPEQDFIPPAEISAHPAWARLEGQRAYYSRRAGEYQDRYKHIKLALIGVAAAIPILAFMPFGEITRFVVALAGVLIAVLEGVLLLNQYGTLWVKYRSTAEGLKRERWLLLSQAGDYKGKTDHEALSLLAERVEALIETEHREWTEQQKKALEALADAQAWVASQKAREAQAGNDSNVVAGAEAPR
jgi:Protein of unknown function (DUF4231)